MVVAGAMLAACGDSKPPVDGGLPPADAGVTADAGPPPADAGPPPADAGTPPADAGTTAANFATYLKTMVATRPDNTEPELIDELVFSGTDAAESEFDSLFP